MRNHRADLVDFCPCVHLINGTCRVADGVTEDEIKQQVDASLYDDEVGVAEMVLEVDEIGAAVHESIAAAPEPAPVFGAGD